MKTGEFKNKGFFIVFHGLSLCFMVFHETVFQRTGFQRTGFQRTGSQRTGFQRTGYPLIFIDGQ